MTTNPALLLLGGALLLPLLPARARPAALLGLPLLTLAAVWGVADGAQLAVTFLELELVPLRGSSVGRLFATIFALMAFAGALYALRQARLLEQVAAQAYAGGAIGVTFAGDLVTLFVFWELMAIGSTLVIWAANTPQAYRASMRYLLVHLFGGVVLMAGIAGHYVDSGSVAFVAMQPDSLAHWLILVGFLVNTGAPPLSAWIPDAYPEASPSGAVFLSAFTTKTAVFALLVGFPGATVLVWIGLWMIFYGIIYALLENDMRRILAYSIVNQVGFMVAGIGIGTEMALNGAAAHAFTHIIYKALLLMSAGSVLYATGKRKCTDLGGLFRTMPLTAFCGTIGALAISSFPLTSGFVSKSMISQAAGDEHLIWVWLALAAATAGVFLHAGIKFPWFVFFQKDSGLRPDEPPLNMRLAMLLFAALCIGLGIFYQPLYALLPFSTGFVPYTGSHVVVQLELLLFSGLAFFVMLPMLQRTLTITLDADWFYRRLAPVLVTAGFLALRAMGRTLAMARDGGMRRIGAAALALHGPQALFARTWTTGGMALWAALLLAGYLLVVYL